MTALVGAIVNSGLLVAASTATLTTGSTTAGNALVVWGFHETITTPYTSITVTDDAGNTWVSGTYFGNSGRGDAAAFCKTNKSSGVRTITVTFNGGTGGVDGKYVGGEFSGGLALFDQAGNTSGFTASPVTATATGADTGIDNLVLAAISCGDGAVADGISDPPTGGAAWTSAAVNQNDNVNAAGELAYRINVGSATNAATWTFTATPLIGGAVAAVWSIKTLSGSVFSPPRIRPATPGSPWWFSWMTRPRLLGGAVSSLNTYVLPAVAGTYTYTGFAATLEKGSVLSAVKGAYIYTGFAATLEKGSVLSAVRGVYTYTGFAATLEKGSVLSAVKGAYVYTGFAAGLLYGRNVGAVSGVYNQTGNAATFPRAYVISAVRGLYSYTGFAATLIYSGAAAPPPGGHTRRRRGR